MTDLLIAKLETLGRLWLPWYVEDEAPWYPASRDRPVKNPRQLRISDLDDAEVQRALRVPGWNEDQRRWMTHMGCVENKRRGLETSLHLAALASPEGPILTGGCHRSCAIYLSRPDSFAVRLTLHDQPSHPDVTWGTRRP